MAFLSCGHKQHVRHRPPFFERPWITTERGFKLSCFAILITQFSLPKGMSRKDSPLIYLRFHQFAAMTDAGRYSARLPMRT